MSESGGEIREGEVGERVGGFRAESQRNRRQVMAAGMAAAMSGRAFWEMLFHRQDKSKESGSLAHILPPETSKLVESQPEVQIQTVSKEVSPPESKIAEHVTVNDSYYAALSPEQKKLVNETAAHLTAVYGPHMEEEFYPTEAAKLEFFTALTEMGLRLNPDNPNLGNQLSAVIAWESGFSPVRVSNNGSKGIGLIQFTGDVPANLGTSAEALEKMTALQQLEVVERYFRSQRNAFGGDFSSLEKTYPLVINPSKINSYLSEELFPKDSPEARRNQVLDKNEDGVITVGDAIATVRDNAITNYGENPDFLDDYRINPNEVS